MSLNRDCECPHIRTCTCTRTRTRHLAPARTYTARRQTGCTEATDRMCIGGVHICGAYDTIADC
jgi:hypothetical protein